MGQAKQRGNFEQRKNEAVSRTEAEKLRLKEERAKWWASLTPEQKTAYWKKQEEKAKMMALISTWAGRVPRF